MNNKSKYTCKDYREEMMLAGLLRRLDQPELSDKDRQDIIKQIKELKSALKID